MTTHLDPVSLRVGLDATGLADDAARAGATAGAEAARAFEGQFDGLGAHLSTAFGLAVDGLKTGLGGILAAWIETGEWDASDLWTGLARQLSDYGKSVFVDGALTGLLDGFLPTPTPPETADPAAAPAAPSCRDAPGGAAAVLPGLIETGRPACTVPGGPSEPGAPGGPLDTVLGELKTLLSEGRADLAALFRALTEFLTFSPGTALPGTALPGTPATPTSASGGVFGPLLTALLPRFAEGGLAVPGGPVLVGERGPELFVPPAAGRIEPRAPAPSVVVNVTAPDVEGFRRSDALIASTALRALARGRRHL